MSVHRRAVAYCVRADVRRSWPSWLALGLLLGVAVGAVVAAAAGARRTDSAFRSLVDETDAISGGLIFPCDREADPGCAPSTEEVLAWPGVADAAPLALIHAPILDADGDVVQINDDANSTGNGEIDVMVPVDGRFGTELNRVRILEGRDADPSRVDEAVLAPVAAADQGVEVGDVLSVFPHADTEAPETWEDPVDVTVVGIGTSAAEIPPKAGFYIQGLHVTPAFAERLGPIAEQTVAVRLEPGMTFQQLAEQPGVSPFVVALDLDDLAADIDAGLRADATALWLVALVGGLASLLVVGPVLVRYAAATAEVDAVLAPLGWSRRDRAARALAHGMAIGGLAVVVTALVVAVSSTRTPIGDARAIDPNPGPELDLLLFAFGALAAVVLPCLVLVPLARRRRAGQAQRRTPLATVAARAGLPPTAVLGLRIGLEPGRRQAPIRSALVAVAVGGTAVVGVLVYTVGAHHLAETPSLAGITWDDMIYLNDQPHAAAIAERARGWPEAEAVGELGFFTPPLLLGPDETIGHVLAFGTTPGAIEPALLDGRAPSAASDLLISPLLAEDLGLEIGDEVSGAFAVGEQVDLEQNHTDPVDFEVVGIGPVPVGAGTFKVGAAITIDGFLQAMDIEDEPNPDFLLIDRRPGTDDAAIADRLAGEGLEVTDFPDFPDGVELLRSVVAIDLTTTESAPKLLGLLMAVMASGVLAYALITTVGHNRHDLAIARALGFAPRHIRRTVAWAATSFTAVALLVAIPFGIVAGRAAWRAYAESLGVIPEPIVPWTEIAWFVVLAVVIANVIALGTAWRQNHLRPAEPLRAE